MKQTGTFLREGFEEKKKHLELNDADDYGLLETVKDLPHEAGSSTPVHLHFKEEDENLNEENVLRSPSSGRLQAFKH